MTVKINWMIEAQQEDGSYEIEDERFLDVCPKCRSEFTSKASGIECSSQSCDYWFCF